MDAGQLAELNKMGQPMSAWEDSRLLRAMFYGDPGAGKTDLCVKICQAIGGKAAFFTTDSAWVTIQKYPDAAKNISRYVFDSFAQLRIFVQAHEEGIEPYNEFKTIVWDTAGTGIDQVLRGLVDVQKFPNQQMHPSLEGYGHYRMVERGLRETVTKLSKSNLNIIYTAHIRDPSDGDKEKKRFAIRPKMPEASFAILAQEVQLLGWLYKESKGSARKLQTEGTLQETGKSQIPGIPEGTLDVNKLPSMIAQWQMATL